MVHLPATFPARTTRSIALLLVTLLAAIVLTGALPRAGAQGLGGEPVTIEAGDGLVLHGVYFAPPAAAETGSPAVLLLHQYGSRKESWDPLITPLTDAGFGVLAVDQRGHGETGGDEDWDLAEQDVQRWLDWLREQPGVDPEQLSVVGASIGSNLALRGMANDDRVVTAVALSPGLDYFGRTTADAIATIGPRPIFLVAAQRDTVSADAVRALVQAAEGDVQARIYPRSPHGTGIFLLEDDLAPAIVNWLEAHH